MYILMIFIVLVAFFLVGFSFYILIDGLKSVKSIKKNGIDVVATITSIKKIKKRDKNNAVYEVKNEIMCEFEYQGKHELELHYNYKLNLKQLKEGSTISCVYDPKKNWLSTKDNIKSSGLFLLFPFFAFILIIILGNINEEVYNIDVVSVFGKTISISDIFMIIVFIIFELFAFKMFDKNYVKGKYIKLDGIVVDIYTHYESGDYDSIGVDVYAPEVSFIYNGKKIKKVTGFWSNVIKYKRGQKVIVYYDPENDITYTRGNNTFAILMMLVGLLCLIPIIKLFL